MTGSKFKVDRNQHGAHCVASADERWHMKPTGMIDRHEAEQVVKAAKVGLEIHENRAIDNPLEIHANPYRSADVVLRAVDWQITDQGYLVGALNYDEDENKVWATTHVYVDPSMVSLDFASKVIEHHKVKQEQRLLIEAGQEVTVIFAGLRVTAKAIKALAKDQNVFVLSTPGQIDQAVHGIQEKSIKTLIVIDRMAREGWRFNIENMLINFVFHPSVRSQPTENKLQMLARFVRMGNDNLQVKDISWEDWSRDNLMADAVVNDAPPPADV